MLKPNGEVTSATSTSPTTARRQQAEQNDVLMRFALCRGRAAAKETYVNEHVLRFRQEEVL